MNLVSEGENVMKKIIIFVIVAALLIPIIFVIVSDTIMFFRYLEKGYDVDKIISIMDLEYIKSYLTTIWLVLVAALLFTCPFFAAFISKRIKFYIMLSSVCSKEGCKFKLKRLPFVSLFGVKYREDICITRGDKKYLIHFIDIVGRAMVFTLIDDKTYDVSKTAADNASITPMFDMRLNSAKRVILDGSKQTIPEFDKNDGEHIIILDPLPMEVRYIDSSVPKPLFSGYSIGNITYYEAKDFIKLLRRI